MGLGKDGFAENRGKTAKPPVAGPKEVAEPTILVGSLILSKIPMTSIDKTHAQPRWFALINDKIVILPRQHLTAGVVLTQAEAPAGHRLVRDHHSPHDPSFDDSDGLDLAEGNVFYTRACADTTPGGHCPGPAKLALAVDDRFELTAPREMAVTAILALFGLPQGTKLFRDYESPQDEPLLPDGHVRFADGPVFYSKASGPDLVTVTINNEKHQLPPGKVTVAVLRKLGNVPDGDELVQVIDRKPHPLPDDGSVCIAGGEEFLSHPRCGSSS